MKAGNIYIWYKTHALDCRSLENVGKLVLGRTDNKKTHAYYI